MLDYDIDAARNLVITRAAGHVTLADLTAHLTRLLRDPAFRSEYNALIVVADVSAVPGPVGIGVITPLVRAWSRRRAGVRWGFVLPNQRTRDIVERAIEEARLTAVSARCFLAESTALTWLSTTPVAPVMPPAVLNR